MDAEEAAIVLGAAALSVAGVAFGLLASTIAKRVANIVGLLGGIIILAVSLLHLAPEALAGSALERLCLIAGASIGTLLELLLRVRVRQEPWSVPLGAWLGLLVLTIHSTLDGAVYTAVFWHELDSGVFASVGLIMHEAPEGVVAMALALHAGLKPSLAAALAVLASSVTTPAGWLLAHAVGENGHQVMQAMFAASAGLLLYVGWHLIASGWRSLKAGQGESA